MAEEGKKKKYPTNKEAAAAALAEEAERKKAARARLAKSTNKPKDLPPSEAPKKKGTGVAADVNKKTDAIIEKEEQK